jgi:zinc transport system permease protein
MLNVIYNIIEYIFPFNFMSYDFMKNALLAIVIISPLFAMVGTMIVNNKMSFFSDALGHSAMTGIAIGIVLGITNYSLSMIIFAVIFAVLLNYLKDKSKVSVDTLIGVFSATSIALGLAIMSKYGGVSKYTSYLIGDILSISINELSILAIISVLVIILWINIFNKLLAVSTNKALAKTKGINPVIIENIFAILTAIIVMLSIKWIGVLLINALIVIPAAASRNISNNMKSYTLNAILIAVLSGILGLILSFILEIATGPTIVVVSATVYLITFILRKK